MVDQYACSTDHSTYCYAELAVSSRAVAETIGSTHCTYHGTMARHPLSTSCIITHHLPDFMVQGKITEADAPTIRLGATPSKLLVPHLHLFYAKCPLCLNPPNLSWLRTGTYWCWLANLVAWFLKTQKGRKSQTITINLAAIKSDIANWINVHWASEEFNVESNNCCTKPIHNEHFSKLRTTITACVRPPLKHPESFICAHPDHNHLILFPPAASSLHHVCT